MSRSHEKTVLIVEKEPNHTQGLVKQIIVAGLRPLIAVTGEGGLRKVEECRPDLILLEVELSDMDGLSFVSEIRQNPEADRIPIVAMSVLPQLKTQCLEAGCDDFLQKPVRMIELMARLKKWVHSSRTLAQTKGLQQEAQARLRPERSERSASPAVSTERQSMAHQKKDGLEAIGHEPETIAELLVLSIATSAALAKLLTENGVIAEEEYRAKILEEWDQYQRTLQKINQSRSKPS